MSREDIMTSNTEQINKGGQIFQMTEKDVGRSCGLLCNGDKTKTKNGEGGGVFEFSFKLVHAVASTSVSKSITARIRIFRGPKYINSIPINGRTRAC